jgi:hypothetical protein
MGVSRLLMTYLVNKVEGAYDLFDSLKLLEFGRRGVLVRRIVCVGHQGVGQQFLTERPNFSRRLRIQRSNISSSSLAGDEGQVSSDFGRRRYGEPNCPRGKSPIRGPGKLGVPRPAFHQFGFRISERPNKDFL